jgi:hypothetical protein
MPTLKRKGLLVLKKRFGMCALNYIKNVNKMSNDVGNNFLKHISHS